MASISSGTIQIEKLRGMEDYNNWKFHMKMLLMHEDLYECIESDNTKDVKKNQKALAKICLSVGPTALAHVRNAASPYQAWVSLQKAYEDRGLCRRLGLLRSLFSMKLKDGQEMSSYVNKITELGQQLADIGSPLDDEFIAVIMLSGLSSDYDPLIMAMENSSVQLSSEMVKSKLLQEQLRREDKVDSSEASALTVRASIICYKCRQRGHRRSECTLVKPSHSGKDRRTSSSTTKKSGKSLLTALSMTVRSDAWIVDSGSSLNLCHNKQIMSDFKCLPPLEVKCANGDVVKTEGCGNVKVNLQKFGLKTISNVYYIPKLSANLLSVSELNRKGYSVTFSSKRCKILDGRELIATATYNNGVYVLDIINNRLGCDVGSETAMNSVSTVLEGCESQPTRTAHVPEDIQASQEVWHKRLGHLNLRSMNLMKNGLVTGMDFDNTTFSPCVACITGKQTKLPFPKKSQSRSNELLGLIYTDICGPVETPSLNGSLYFILFIDDYSRKTFIYFLRRKSEAFEKFKLFKALVENETNKKIKIIRSDNGGEYMSNNFQNYLRSCGIKHQTTVPHCSEQNGVAERAHRTIMDKTRCMLQDAGLGKQYWAEAANTAVYLKNRSPTKAVMGTTPEEKWTSKKVNVQHLRTFGCIAYALVENKRKLEPRSKSYIFVGYCEDTKGYRLIDPTCPRRCVKAKHVTFLENKFIKDFMSHDDSSVNKDTVVFLDNSSSLSNEPLSCSERSEEMISQQPPEQPGISMNETFTSDDINPRRQTIFCLDDTDDTIGTDYWSDHTYVPETSKLSSTETSSDYTFDDALDLEGYAGLAEMLNAADIPTTVEQARQSSEAREWEKAILDEYNSFTSNNCWTLVDLPKGQKAVKCKWVFSKKRDPSGALKKYKARLVAKGYSQRHGIDYHETFSPVVRYSTIRILLAIAAMRDMTVEHLDVKTAFLNGNLEENVYMQQPEGFIKKGQERKVYKLNKAIYGLKQAAKAWNEKINNVLINKLGFKRLSSEPCVYIYNHKNELMIIALYVDDIMLFSSKTCQMKSVIKEKLMEEFDITDLGTADCVLGMKIIRTHDGNILLNQSSYIKRILEKFNMFNCKPAATPMEVGLKLQKGDCQNCNFDYRSLIGYLMYLAVCSRPDIAHSVSYLSQFNNCYSEEHWKAAKRILRYLKGTIDFSLNFQKEGKMVITGFTDADWGSTELDRKSYTGYVFSLGNSVVSWESRKQRTVALSSTEAEYMAVSDSCREALFLQTFVRECLGLNCEIKIFNDNQSAQKICKNTVCHSRTKHIDIRHHFVRDLISKKIIELCYVPTESMIADVLTKPLTKDKHCKCISDLLKV